MRLDHIAYRVKDRFKTARLFIECLGYRIADDLPEGFKIEVEDGSSADCLVLLPPEQIPGNTPWMTEHYFNHEYVNYHLPPEIFISDGSADSIVGKWVEERGGVGGIHHMAFQVNSVQNKMLEWEAKGFVEFATPHPMTCPGLVQVFTKPSELTGVIYELIERESHGFCRDNVKALMESTKDFSQKKRAA